MHYSTAACIILLALIIHQGFKASGGSLPKYVIDKSRSLPKLSMQPFTTCEEICELCLFKDLAQSEQENIFL